MAALKSPLMPSPTGSGLSSAFSPYTDSPGSPLPQAGSFQKRSSGQNSDSLAPATSPYRQQIEPSPVDSNGTDGTEGTDIDDAAQETEQEGASGESSTDATSPDADNTSPQSVESDRAVRIDTQVMPRDSSQSPENAPQSVIHAPEGFKGFEEARAYTHTRASRSTNTVVSPTVESPTTPEAIPRTPEDMGDAHIPPLGAALPSVMPQGSPQALPRDDLEQDANRASKRRSVLHDIPEGQDKEGQDDSADETQLPDATSLNQVQEAVDIAEQEVEKLRTALSDCWTLCESFANLSSSHRQRTFQFSGHQQVQEHAWRTCWRLCQELYRSRDEYDASQAMTTLELCREFCQALFEARQKLDEDVDSVLRVSFELNNHLYNTRDPTLPEAFNERTLDFYVTLCHRLMKQQTSLPHETDALLRACWTLAEMLFNIRQSNRDGKRPDQELVGSAVQACWELCDLFREGWSQVRPDRGTPRPSQTTFGFASSVKSASVRSSTRSKSSLSNRPFVETHPPPETPTTIFDDTTTASSSPDSVSVPNILVLGPSSSSNNNNSSSSSNTSRNNTNDDSHHDRWTSNASVLSYSSSSASSQHTSSTATAEQDQVHLIRLRCLLLKVGMNNGYDRSSGQQLTAYVRNLPPTAFGTLPWQMKVLTYYKKLVMGDKSMLSAHTIPPRRLGAREVAKSIKWLGDSGTWAWMRDLFRLVFGFGIDEADRNMGSIQI